MADHEPVPFLRKPTIYIPCDHGIKPVVVKDGSRQSVGSESEINATVSVEVKVTTDFDKYNQPIRKVCECKITFDENKAPNKKREGESLSEIREEAEDNTESKGMIEEQPSSNQPPPVAIKDSVKSNKTEKLEKTSIALSTFGLGKTPMITNKELYTSSATEQLQKELNVGTAPAKTADRKQIQPKTEEEQLVTLGKRVSMECKCKEEVQKFIETNLCQCEKCKADRAAATERKKPTYIISGMQEIYAANRQHLEEAEDAEEEREDVNEEKTVVPVIAGVKSKKTCDCLRKYQARTKMYEEMKKRFDAQHNLKTLQKQYVIGGVTHSPTGDPVYMLSGVLPEKECACAKAYEEQLKEERRLANMPTIPLGRQKYIISGVHETEQGNIFVLSGAAAIEDCSCLRMYKCYEHKHIPCLQTYQEYLKKIEIDKEEYMKEIATDGRFGDIEPTEQPASVSIYTYYVVHKGIKNIVLVSE